MPGSRAPLGELARLFLKLGATAFGGPAAHIALMEDEVVRRRAWLTRGEFLDYVGAANLIPGPTSTELAIHIGHLRAGVPGLLVAGACFIVPATLLVGLAAWAYVTYGTMPAVSGVLYGIKPVVIAVVAQALWGLGRTALKSPWLAAIGVGAVAAVAAGVHELVVLAVAAAIAPLAHALPRGRSAATILAAAAAAGVPAGVGAAGTVAPATFGLWPLFLVFAKIGSVLFGSGYVLLAFLRSDLVDRLGWLTEAQLVDAVAVGQVTPGPVFTTATFVGYLLGGPAAAAVATLGIFLPAFVFVGLSGPIVPRLRRSRVAGTALDGVNVASLALMAVVTWQLGRVAIVDVVTVTLALVSAAALIRYRVSSTWLIASGALVGWLVSRA